MRSAHRMLLEKLWGDTPEMSRRRTSSALVETSAKGVSTPLLLGLCPLPPPPSPPLPSARIWVAQSEGFSWANRILSNCVS